MLPTRNRAAFIPQAIRSYQSQTFRSRELVIVDNGDDGTGALIPNDPSITYLQVPGDRTTGEMRNLCAEAARGDILCHFDSDDWSAPTRVTDQVTRLGASGVLTGYHAMFFYDVRDGHCYHWQRAASPEYILGTSMCYRREWWKAHHFPAMSVGEDTRFFKQARREAARHVASVAAGPLMVARIHGQQTSPKSLTRTSYVPVPRAALPEAFPCGSMSSAT